LFLDLRYLASPDGFVDRWNSGDRFMKKPLLRRTSSSDFPSFLVCPLLFLSVLFRTGSLRPGRSLESPLLGESDALEAAAATEKHLIRHVFVTPLSYFRTFSDIFGQEARVQEFASSLRFSESRALQLKQKLRQLQKVLRRYGAETADELLERAEEAEEKLNGKGKASGLRNQSFKEGFGWLLDNPSRGYAIGGRVGTRLKREASRVGRIKEAPGRLLLLLLAKRVGGQGCLGVRADHVSEQNTSREFVMLLSVKSFSS
jgi:hypothetical protein